MGGGVGCVDEKVITFDDRKKNAFHFTMGGGGGGGEGRRRIKVMRSRVRPYRDQLPTIKIYL